MSSVEIVAFTCLWVGFLMLAALVLLLYRQVQRQYEGAAGSASGLLPGVSAPDIEILTPTGIGPLQFPAEDELALFAFVSTSCDTCHSLLELIKAREIFSGRAIALVNGETTDKFRAYRECVEMEWLAHPPDIARSYGVSGVPMVYALRGRTILASAGASTASELRALLQLARSNEHALADEQSADAGTAAAETLGAGAPG